jgi:hypothetical protein
MLSTNVTHYQTAIALSSLTQPDRLFPPSNSDRTLITHTTRSPISPIKQRSPLNTHKPDLHFPTSNNDRLNYEYFILMLIRYNISDKFAKEGQIYD